MPSEIQLLESQTLSTPPAGSASIGLDDYNQIILLNDTGEQFIQGYITKTFTLDYTEFSAAATVETINKFTMPGKWQATYVRYHLEDEFAASGLSAAEVTMKTGGDITVMGAWDVFQTGGNDVGTTAAVSYGGDEIPDISTTTTMRFALQLTGANIDTLTAGKLNIDITFYVSP